MERLGHSSITVTLNTYGHLFPSLDQALTDGLETTYRASVAGRTTAGEQVPSVTQIRARTGTEWDPGPSNIRVFAMKHGA